MTSGNQESSDAIAVVGIAGRLPGAGDMDQFWQNQVEMVSGVRNLSRDELSYAGLSDAMINRRDFVAKEATIDDIDRFDAPFFRFTATEAELMDPQIRIMHELAWHTLENGGCDPTKVGNRIGIFATTHMSTYWLHNLAGVYREADPNELLQIAASNSQDYPATTVAYRLGLTGPALNIHTACSSSLVAVNTACQNLLDGSCDSALALAVSITLPQGAGYLATAESIYSPDGTCRPFDADANGTIAGDGAVGILLKRLEDAEAQGDRILSVIRGWATNNDGNRKIGFTAPSIEGQQELLMEAAQVAGIAPGDLDYLETHGTGTSVGDPIEFEAIKAIHGRSPQPGRRLALSSLKSSIGHLGGAAGLAGLVRTVLALHQGQMPGTVNFNRLNPKINPDKTQLYVLKKGAPFQTSDRARRAAVSSFGIGGTNAHTILENYGPQQVWQENQPSSGMEVVGLSGHDPAALDRNRTRWIDWLRNTRRPATELHFPSIQAISDSSLLDRTGLPYRLAVAGQSNDQIAKALESISIDTYSVSPDLPKICFVFTGSGIPSLSHSKHLAESFPAFRDALKKIDRILARQGMPPATDWLTAAAIDKDERDIRRSHIAAFAFGYAHARLWQSAGLRSAAVIGHSMGEITAACVAGAADLSDALKFVAERAAAIADNARPGELLAVAAERADLDLHLEARPALSIAGENGVGQYLVAGSSDAVQKLRKALQAEGTPSSILPAGQAFHSDHMEPAQEAIYQAAEGVFRPGNIPIASTVTGTLEKELISNPCHWAEQMTLPVNFTGAIDAALSAGCTLFLELGPKPTFAVGGNRTLTERGSDAAWLCSLGTSGDNNRHTVDDLIAQTRARLFELGFPTLPPHRSRRTKTTLPGYCFSDHRYWRDAHANKPTVSLSLSTAERELQGVHVLEQVPNPIPEESSAEEMLRSILARIWAQELGLRDIPDRGTFLGLGGTSLAALKVAGAIEEQIGVRPPIASLTQSESFADFVSVVTELLIQEEEAAAVAPSELHVETAS